MADATFGGYLIITVALLLGKIFGEIPTQRRIMEWVFLGVGAVLFIVLGKREFVPARKFTKLARYKFKPTFH